MRDLLVHYLTERSASLDYGSLVLTTLRQHARAAGHVLDWLASQQLDLRTCTLRDLDAWLTSDDAHLKHEAGHFIRWAKRTS